MKYIISARYHLWLEREVEADDEDQALDKVLHSEMRADLKRIAGFVDFSLEDCGVEEVKS